MSARFCRIITPASPNIVIRDFIVNMSLTIVPLSKYIEQQPSYPGIHRTVAGKCSRYPTL